MEVEESFKYSISEFDLASMKESVNFLSVGDSLTCTGNRRGLTAV